MRSLVQGKNLALIIALPVLLCFAVLFMEGCQGLNSASSGGGNPSAPGDPSTPTPPPPSGSQTDFSGVLMWKGDNSKDGLYGNETTLTLANVNPSQFGKKGSFHADGLIVAQPLYVRNVDMGSAGTHNLVIVVTEHDSVYALDADNLSAGPLWQRHYVDSNGFTVLPDNFGGRTTLGGQIGITGTPVIDPHTGAMYFVTTLENNGVPQQWIRSIDIRSGQDYGAGSMQIQASVPGDGKASVNGQIAFDPSIQNQRAGLAELNGSILVAWGSFSDFGVYHGWLMAFDASSLKLQAVFNPTPQAQTVDPASGPADHGGGAAFWQGGAGIAIDDSGNIYLSSADGSFNADQGGKNYGDTLLKLNFDGSNFNIVDWFTPDNQACIDVDDLELGSGGVAILPTDFTNGVKLVAANSKEGRLFLTNQETLGHFNASTNQVAQEFMVGEHSCTSSTTGAAADGTSWDRLYGDPSYWNGYLYAQAANLPLKQYQFQNGLLNPTPIAESPSSSGVRGANTVVSANGNQNAIVWAYEKSSSNQGILHAYNATNVSTELWNSNMNAGRDQLGTGVAFATPVVVDGHVFTSSDVTLTAYGLL